MNVEHTESFEGFAILELMGHRRLAGWLSEQEIAGHGFLRIDIPLEVDGEPEEWPTDRPDGTTQFYSPASVYAITPCTKEIAVELAKSGPKPVNRWDLRALLPAPEPVVQTRHWEDAEPETDADFDDMPL